MADQFIEHRLAPKGQIHGIVNWSVENEEALDNITVAVGAADLFRVAAVGSGDTTQFYTLVSSNPIVWVPISSAGAPVQSFMGRTGAIFAAPGDYSAEEISEEWQENVQAAIDRLRFLIDEGTFGALLVNFNGLERILTAADNGTVFVCTNDTDTNITFKVPTAADEGIKDGFEILIINLLPTANVFIEALDAPEGTDEIELLPPAPSTMGKGTAISVLKLSDVQWWCSNPFNVDDLNIAVSETSDSAAKAKTYKEDTELLAGEVSDAKDVVVNAKDAAVAAKELAEDAANAAGNAADDAEDAKDEAVAWAITPEDVPIPGTSTGRSALHYAAKAAESAAQAAGVDFEEVVLNLADSGTIQSGTIKLARINETVTLTSTGFSGIRFPNAATSGESDEIIPVNLRPELTVGQPNISTQDAWNVMVKTTGKLLISGETATTGPVGHVSVTYSVPKQLYAKFNGGYLPTAYVLDTPNGALTTTYDPGSMYGADLIGAPATFNTGEATDFFNQLLADIVDNGVIPQTQMIVIQNSGETLHGGQFIWFPSLLFRLSSTESPGAFSDYYTYADIVTALGDADEESLATARAVVFQGVFSCQSGDNINYFSGETYRSIGLAEGGDEINFTTSGYEFTFSRTRD